MVSNVDADGASPSLAPDMSDFFGVESEMTVRLSVTESFSWNISGVLNEYDNALPGKRDYLGNKSGVLSVDQGVFVLQAQFSIGVEFFLRSESGNRGGQPLCLVRISLVGQTAGNCGTNSGEWRQLDRFRKWFVVWFVEIHFALELDLMQSRVFHILVALFQLVIA